MKKETAFVLVIGAMTLCCAGYSNATVLGTIENNGAGISRGTPHEIIFSIGYPTIFDSGWDWLISFSWDVTSDDVGETFFASAETHENFDVFASFLTNGIDNFLHLKDNYSITKFGSELPSSQFESALINGIRDGVDFEGYTIDSIALTVNELFFLDYALEPKSARGGFAIGNYSYDITYTINGAEVPEPATVFLLALGGLALLRKRQGVKNHHLRRWPGR